MTKIINLTPHALVLAGPAGQTTLQPSGTVARVSSTPGPARAVDGCPVPVHAPDTLGAVEGLPAPQPGTYYVVSALVGAACPRADVLVPGTGPGDAPIRDAGRIVAVTRLKATV